MFLSTETVFVRSSTLIFISGLLDHFYTYVTESPTFQHLLQAVGVDDARLSIYFPSWVNNISVVVKTGEFGGTCMGWFTRGAAMGKVTYS